MLSSDLGFDAAPRLPVARDHDRTFDGDAATSEFLVIGRPPVVDVDERSGHIAIDRIGVERR